jgi:hypothetical protein
MTGYQQLLHKLFLFSLVVVADEVPPIADDALFEEVEEEVVVIAAVARMASLLCNTVSKSIEAIAKASEEIGLVKKALTAVMQVAGTLVRKRGSWRMTQRASNPRTLNKSIHT